MADTKTFKKDSQNLVKDAVKTQKDATKDDANAIAENFKPSTTDAGPTVPDASGLETILATYTATIVLTEQTSGTSGSCDLVQMPAYDGCQWRPADDLKVEYLCGIGGSFYYGTEGYSCGATNLPSALFCADIVAAATTA